MNILYISHSHEGTGFSFAAHNYIKALLTTGYDVTCRHIKLNQNNPKVPDFITGLEKKKIEDEDVDVVIQHVLPHHMSYIYGVKNIGLCVYDTDSLRQMQWDRYLNCMDEVWLPNTWTTFQKEITPRVRYIPHTFDTSIYTKQFEPLQIRETAGSCVFYTIADLNARKNIRDFVIAFYNEFHSNEPANIVLKVSKHGTGPDELANALMGSISDIKKDMKLYPNISDYKQELLITNSVTEQEINQLHTSFYCYVNTSRGEAWNMPQFDAWAFGNRIIYYQSPIQSYPYLNGNHYRIDTEVTPCFGYNDTFQGLGTSRENWGSSDISLLQKSMRIVYNEWCKNPNKLLHKDYEKYSYESVGKLMKVALNGK